MSDKNYKTITIIAIVAIVIIVIAYFIYSRKPKQEEFCNKNVNVDMGSDVLVPKDIAKNTFYPELPLYKIGLNTTNQKCQDLSINLVQKVSDGCYTNDKANDEWFSKNCGQ